MWLFLGTGICVVKHQQMQGKWLLKASVCGGNLESSLGPGGRKATLLGKEHVGGKRKGVLEDESWRRLDPVLSADLRLHHPGRREPVVWSLALASLHVAGRPPPPLAQKFQTFPPAGRGRVLLS